MLPRVPLANESVDDFAHAGAEAVERVREAAAPLRGSRVLRINTTAFGGGGAELLQGQLPVMRDLGLDVAGRRDRLDRDDAKDLAKDLVATDRREDHLRLMAEIS